MSGSPFAHRLVAPGEAIEAWPAQVGFPCHGLIARPHRSDGVAIPGSGPLIKGIREPGELARALQRCSAASRHGVVLLETAMRGHCNPTCLRMIRTLAFRLVRPAHRVRPG